MNIAIIPARGGSERITKKNISLFAGKPIIAYAIETAIQSGCFDQVIVSTEDQAIAKIAKAYSAQVPFFRPANIANNYATTLEVMQHAITWCSENQQEADYYCCLYPCTPLLTAALLQQGLQRLQQTQCDFVFTAKPFPTAVQRAFTITEQNNIALITPEYQSTRTQDLAPSYHDAGQFYWGTKQAFLTHQSIFTARAQAIVLNQYQAVDIDTKQDWALAEILYQLNNESRI